MRRTHACKEGGRLLCLSCRRCGVIRFSASVWTHANWTRTPTHGSMAMKTQRRKRPQLAQEDSVAIDTTAIFSSDLLTPEEERELLATFWECKSELVRALIRHFPRLRAHRPVLEPWPMAQFIRDYCDSDTRQMQPVR